ncbi:MAG TPA: hypothetical protein PKN13_06255 [Accumulibacter sp.]|nr:hypothetical protein [Accumulibacter sp.]HMW17403.1 hypothetical protein [Accumulibacter sp.]HMX23433.1 hypothetical protein [Accumulibacter sp.]HNC17826.1 hypothetical protein [Accumulibacter sp.]HND80129.1 hypothetical protein [Accumulibacter sp.]
MALAFVGLTLMAMGILAGAALVVAPLGLLAIEAHTTLWILFPLLSFVGYGLLVIGADARTLRMFSKLFSLALVILSLVAVMAVLLHAMGLLQLTGSTYGVWYVMVVAGIVGSVGVAAFGDREQSSWAKTTRE